MTATIPCSRDGRFTETTTVRALPTEPGNYVQTKFFPGGYSMLTNSSVPSRIFFDMRLGPVAPNINESNVGNHSLAATTGYQFESESVGVHSSVAV
jgi:hypothetical protein